MMLSRDPLAQHDAHSAVRWEDDVPGLVWGLWSDLVPSCHAARWALNIIAIEIVAYDYHIII